MPSNISCNCLVLSERARAHTHAYAYTYAQCSKRVTFAHAHVYKIRRLSVYRKDRSCWLEQGPTHLLLLCFGLLDDSARASSRCWTDSKTRPRMPCAFLHFLKVPKKVSFLALRVPLEIALSLFGTWFHRCSCMHNSLAQALDTSPSCLVCPLHF